MTSKRMLLLSQCNESRPFGSHLRPKYLSRYLTEFGWTISHVCISLKELKQKVIEIPYLSKQFSKSPRLLVKHGLDLRRFYAAWEDIYDVIYVHGSKNQVACLLAGIHRNRTVFDFHGLGFMETRGIISFGLLGLEKMLSKFPKTVIVTSNDVKKILMKISGPPSRIMVVPNGIDTSKVYPLSEDRVKEAKKTIGLVDKFVVISMNPPDRANYAAYKLTFSVAKRLLELGRRDITFIILGMDMKKSPLPNIRFFRFVEDLNLFLNIADAAIASYPHNAWRPGPINKVLEYMACDLPVIATRNGIRGIDEARDHIHFIYSNPTVNEFIENILILQADADFRCEVGERARALILSNYSWKTQAKKLDGILSRISNA